MQVQGFTSADPASGESDVRATIKTINDSGGIGRRGRIPCDVKALQTTAPIASVVVSASLQSTPVPHCLVNGYALTSGPGSNNNPNRFVLALPDRFAGRILQIATGGSCGSLAPPPTSELEQGFAWANTDCGHESPPNDWNFAFDLTKAWDYGFRSIDVTARATQQITRGYYTLDRNDKMYRYLNGCSGGGRIGLIAANRFPDDFDGIISGAPGGAHSLSTIVFIGMIVQYLQNHPAAWIPASKLALAQAAVLSRWDGADGVIDGMISDSRVIDPDELVSFVRSLGIMSDAQMETVSLMVHPYDTGVEVLAGRPASYMTNWGATVLGQTPPPWPASGPGGPALVSLLATVSQVVFGANFNFYTDLDFNNKAQLRTLINGVATTLFPEPISTDLSQFANLHHKLLIWQGTSDQAVPFQTATHWFDEVAGKNGGHPRTEQFSRLFLAPGVFHCAGGPGPQDTPNVALAALVKWVEGGPQPHSLITHAASPSNRTFLLCPYPSAAVFDGGRDNPKGLNVNDAQSWSCRN